MTRTPLPDTRPGTLRRFRVGTVTGHFVISNYDDGSPGELFVWVDPREADPATVAWADQWATGISIALQHGADPATVFGKFRGARFEPTDRHASSIPDAIARVVLAEMEDENA